MTAPLVSFVVPTYNRAALVARAIESVRRELPDPTDAEVVVVDDGSTDDTAAVLAPYDGLSGIRVIRFSTNRGLAAARNAAIRAAAGCWIALLDSDNHLVEGAGAALTATLRAAPGHAGVVWAASVDSSGERTVTHGRAGIFSGRAIVEGDFTGEHFSVVRRHLALACPYPTEAGSHGCEPAFWAAVACRTHFLVTSEVLQEYTTTGADRICAAENRIRRAADFARCFEITARVLDGLSANEAARARARAAFYTVLAGDHAAGLRSAFRALRRGPLTRDGVLALAVTAAGPRVARRVARLQ